MQQEQERIEKIVDDLTQLIIRLVHALKKSNEVSDLPEKAMEYLKSKELIKSPLR